MIMILKRLNNIFYFSLEIAKTVGTYLFLVYLIGSTTTPDQTNYSMANPATSRWGGGHTVEFWN